MSIPELQALARKHWTKWLPEKVKELRASGTLEEALHGAASLAQAEIDHLTSKLGYQQHEAREVALKKFILLQPEPQANESPAERQELAQKESEYRKHPPVPSE